MALTAFSHFYISKHIIKIEQISLYEFRVTLSHNYFSKNENQIIIDNRRENEIRLIKSGVWKINGIIYYFSITDNLLDQEPLNENQMIKLL